MTRNRTLTTYFSFLKKASSPCIIQWLQPDTVVPEPYNPHDWNRFSYVRKNPIRFNDPTGHVVACDKDDADCSFHWDYPPPTDQLKKYSKKLTEKQERNHELFMAASEIVVSVIYEPADWLLTFDDYKQNGFNPWMLLGLLPLIPNSAGRHADDIVETGYDSFRQLKNAIGNPGDDMDWHHIVEQIQIKKSGFSPQQIHNTNNVIAVDRATHNQVSGFYSSIRPFTNGLRVRDWIAGQSFEAQYNFGIQVLKDFGVLP